MRMSIGYLEPLVFKRSGTKLKVFSRPDGSALIVYITSPPPAIIREAYCDSPPNKAIKSLLIEQNSGLCYKFGHKTLISLFKSKLLLGNAK